KQTAVLSRADPPAWLDRRGVGNSIGSYCAPPGREIGMPPRGVKPGTKRARQYEHIKQGVQDQGASESRAEEIAARTVNKQRARAGESETASRTSTEDIS